MRNRLFRWLPSGIAWTLLGLVGSYLQPAFLWNTEWRTYDHRTSFRSDQPSPDVVLVGIDQASLEQLGFWPISRTHYVKLIERLAAGGAKVIGMDITFPMPQSGGLSVAEGVRTAWSEAGAGKGNAAFTERLEAIAREADVDAALAEAIKKAGNVVTGEIFFFQEGESSPAQGGTAAQADPAAFAAIVQEPPGSPVAFARTFPGYHAFALQKNLPAIREVAGPNTGHLNVFAENDSVFRRASIAIEYEGRMYPAFGLQVYRVFRGVPPEKMALVHDSAALRQVAVGDERIPVDSSGFVLVNYGTGASPYRELSFADVVAGKVEPEAIRGKAVLVGATAPGIGDVLPSPWGLQAGIQNHAHLLDTLITRRAIQHGRRESLIDILVMVFFGVGLAVILGILPPAWTIPGPLALLIVYVAIAYWLFASFGIWISVTLPTMVLLLNSGWIAARTLAGADE